MALKQAGIHPLSRRHLVNVTHTASQNDQHATGQLRLAMLDGPK